MISKKMKYAIKALICLAQKEGQNGCIKTSEIARQDDIPKKFLEHILLDLKRAHIVSSRQGNTGGYYLLKSADDITMAELYRLFEGPIALLPCASETFYEPCTDCKDITHCKIRISAQLIHRQTLEAMRQVTLRSLLPDK